MPDYDPYAELATNSSGDKGDLTGLAFVNPDGTVEPPIAKPPMPVSVEQPKEGEVMTTRINNNAEYPSSFTPHVERVEIQEKQKKKREAAAPRNRAKIPKRERPPLLSALEQRDLIDQRRANLERKGSTKDLHIFAPLEMYARLVEMAANEHMAGSFKHSFNYFVSWCVLVGLKYYETNGLTHNNPDKIDFSAVPDYTRRMPELEHPADMRAALAESTTPRIPIHPILGRLTEGARYRDSVVGGEQLSPPDKDYSAEENDPSATYTERPPIYRGEPAFDRDAIASGMRSLLPSSHSG